MEIRKLEQALARLEKALTRAENAVGALPDRANVTRGELEHLRQRHDRLKNTVANSLKQLDEILAGVSS